MTTEFTNDQLNLLKAKLDPRLTKTRPGSGRQLTYIGGHTAIDQMNRIFGYGNWEFEPVSCDLAIMVDPLTGEGLGCAYNAIGKLTVNGKVIIEVGSQTVSPSSMEDCIMARRVKEVKGTNKDLDTSEFTIVERINARTTIMDAHENARKGAVTDAMKRAARCYGDQFGNALYGDGRIDVDITSEQITRIQKGAELIGVELPENLNNFSFEEAKILIDQYTKQYAEKVKREKEAEKAAKVSAPVQAELPKPTPPPVTTTKPTPTKQPVTPEPVKLTTVPIVSEADEDKTPATLQQTNWINKTRQTLNVPKPENETLTFKSAGIVIQQLRDLHAERAAEKALQAATTATTNKAS